MLTGCAASGTDPGARSPLPPLPADLGVCFNDTVPAPAEGPMSRAEVMRLIAALKQSETSKTMCGKRLIAFYESLG